jgi:hypothetical protein
MGFVGVVGVLWGCWGGWGGRVAKNVKSSRFGPIELVVEAKFVGASPQLTPDRGWSTKKKNFF